MISMIVPPCSSGAQQLAVQPAEHDDRARPPSQRDLLVRQRLRRQLAARQEVLRAPPRLDPRQEGGLAGRTHVGR